MNGDVIEFHFGRIGLGGMDKAINNPLYGLQVGSTVTSTGGHGATVLEPGLTKFIAQQSSTELITGASKYVYSDKMNQGSLSFAGSYGVSGLAKVSGALTAYLGNTTASDSKTLSLNMNVLKWAGVEHIAFNDLDAADLLAGLSGNAQSDAIDVLEAFNKAATGTEADKKKAMRSWVQLSNEFLANYGEAIVVGILWGGWGTASLTFELNNSEDKWEAGGSGSFSYVNEGLAIDVAATYGHSQDAINKDASATVTMFANGACIMAQTSKWGDDLSALATRGLDALGSQPVSKAPAMNGPLKPPSIPDFYKPKQDKKITDLITSIDSLDGLKAYAQASAFEKQKGKDGGIKDLDEFLESAKKKNDVSSLPRSASTPLLTPDSGDDEIIAMASLHSEMELNSAITGGETTDRRGGEGPTSSGRAPDTSDYEPLGIWTLPWGRLFPWLVTGHDNRIPTNSGIGDLVTLKTLQQDFLSLASIYRRIGSASPELTFSRDNAVANVDFLAIANEFSACASSISDSLAKKDGGRPEKIRTVIRDAIRALGKDSRSIYNTWSKPENSGLRQCELGAGILFRHDTDTGNSKTISYIGDENNHLYTKETGFDPEVGNFSQFSDAVKAWPFVLPDGRIGAFVCDGTKRHSGFLTAWLTDPVGCFTSLKSKAIDYNRHDFQGHSCPDDRNLLIFEAGPKSSFISYCYSGPSDAALQCKVTLYPIPFSAASGVPSWKGTSLTFGTGDLTQTLGELREDLSKLNQWSFDDELWVGTDAKKIRYSMLQVRPQYLGVVDELKSVWG